MTDKNFIHIPGFIGNMFPNLSAGAYMLYGIIYGFTQGDNQVYRTSLQAMKNYAAPFLKGNTVDRAFKELRDAGLVTSERDGNNGTKYKAVVPSEPSTPKMGIPQNGDTQNGGTSTPKMGGQVPPKWGHQDNISLIKDNKQRKINKKEDFSLWLQDMGMVRTDEYGERWINPQGEVCNPLGLWLKLAVFFGYKRDTVIEIGEDRIKPEELQKIVEACDYGKTGIKAWAILTTAMDQYKYGNFCDYFLKLMNK